MRSLYRLLWEMRSSSFNRNIINPSFIFPKRNKSNKDKPTEEIINNLLYNVERQPSSKKRHILECLVYNEPGVLSKVSGLLASRNFNIQAIAAARSNLASLTRITLVFIEPIKIVELVQKQLENLEEVIGVINHKDTNLLERELLLVKIDLLKKKESEAIVCAKYESNLELLTCLTKIFHGSILDLTQNSVVIQIIAKGSRIDGFLDLIKLKFVVLESVRSGPIVISRAKSGNIDVEENENISLDPTKLPPG